MGAFDLIRVWASDLNFSSGPDSGTPTKVDPGDALAAQGAIAGLPLLAANWNFHQNSVSVAVRQMQLAQILGSMAPVPAVGFTIDSGTFVITPVYSDDAFGGRWILIHNIKNTAALDPAGMLVLQNSNAAAADAATDGTQILIAKGTAGNGIEARQTFTSGAFVNASTNLDQILGSVDLVIYDSDADEFICVNGNAGDSQIGVSTSADRLTWGTPVADGGGDPVGAGGVAHLVGGKTLIQQGAAGSTVFRRATVDNFTYETTSGTIPDAASETQLGDLTAIGSTYVYASNFGASDVRIHTSVDGDSWQLATTLVGVGGDCRLLFDSYSGAVYLVVDTGSSESLVFASLDEGATWVGPVRGDGTELAWGAAGGYLWHRFDDVLLRTTVRLPKAI